MKNIGRLCVLLMLLLSPFINRAQCTDSTEQYLSFDTLMSGSGNGYYDLNFPKFNAALGTLVEVRLQSEVNLRYYFNLENRDANPVNNYRVRITRDDEISGEEIINPIYNSILNSFGPYRLGSHDGISGEGTDYVSAGPMYVLNKYKIDRTLHNTADFMGSGPVNINYVSTTYSAVLGSVNYNFNGNAEDTVRFRFTYVYCSGIFLASNLAYFSATKKDAHVQLNWSSLNDVNGRRYDIQKSADGVKFTTIDNRYARVASNVAANYSHLYVPQPHERGKLIFRIRQVDKDGETKYSALKSVDLGTALHAKMTIYPNPSRGDAMVVFHRSQRSDWRLTVFDLNGKMIMTQEYKNALQARLSLPTAQPRGTYLIKATNARTGLVLIEKIVLQ